MTCMTTSCSMWPRVVRILTFKNSISCTRLARTSECLGPASGRSTSTSTFNHRPLTRETIKSGSWPIRCINTGECPLPRHDYLSRPCVCLSRHVTQNTKQSLERFYATRHILCDGACPRRIIDVLHTHANSLPFSREKNWSSWDDTAGSLTQALWASKRHARISTRFCENETYLIKLVHSPLLLVPEVRGRDAEEELANPSRARPYDLFCYPLKRRIAVSKWGMWIA